MLRKSKDKKQKSEEKTREVNRSIAKRRKVIMQDGEEMKTVEKIKGDRREN